MPPLAHNTLDANAATEIAAWINSLPLNTGADTLSVQFNDANAGNIVTGTAGAAAKSNWNTCSGANGNNQALFDNNGGTSQAAVSWNAPNTGSNGGPNSGGNDSLLKGYLDTTTSGVSTVTISNLPFRFTTCTSMRMEMAARVWGNTGRSPPPVPAALIPAGR